MKRIIIEFEGAKEEETLDAFHGYWSDSGGQEGFLTTCWDQGLYTEGAGFDRKTDTFKYKAI